MIWEIIHGSLKLDASVSAPEFYEWSRLRLMYISLIISGEASLISMAFSCLCCITQINHFFPLYQQNKSSECKGNFRQASNHCKRIFDAVKPAYANKTKEFINSQKRGSCDFWRIADSVLKKGKSAIPTPFNSPEVLPSPSNKAKLFPQNFSKNFNVNESGTSLPTFPSRTNLELHNISVTPKLVKKVITNVDLVLIVFQWWF